MFLLSNKQKLLRLLETGIRLFLRSAAWPEALNPPRRESVFVPTPACRMEPVRLPVKLPKGTFKVTVSDFSDLL